MNCLAARKKLKRHVDKQKAARKKLKIEKYKTDEDFVITESLVAYWWRIINRAAFQGRMEQPEIAVKKLRGKWGECTGHYKDGSVVIDISEEIRNRELLISIIAHEMVHQWQWKYRSNKMSHGDTFTAWKQWFKDKFGILI